MINQYFKIKQFICNVTKNGTIAMKLKIILDVVMSLSLKHRYIQTGTEDYLILSSCEDGNWALRS